MNVEQLRTDLHRTCKQIGASFTLEEAEGEIRACIVCGTTWWHLIQPESADGWLWNQQLCELQHHLLN
jgi:hypothetical protein